MSISDVFPFYLIWNLLCFPESEDFINSGNLAIIFSDNVSFSSFCILLLVLILYPVFLTLTYFPFLYCCLCILNSSLAPSSSLLILHSSVFNLLCNPSIHFQIILYFYFCTFYVGLFHTCSFFILLFHMVVMSLSILNMLECLN